MPSYWIPADGNEDNLELCNSPQLKQIHGLYDELLTLYDEANTHSGGSCDRMSIISLIDEKMDNSNGQNLTVNIRYVAQSYQEVTLAYLIMG